MDGEYPISPGREESIHRQWKDIDEEEIHEFASDIGEEMAERFGIDVDGDCRLSVRIYDRMKVRRPPKAIPMLDHPQEYEAQEAYLDAVQEAIRTASMGASTCADAAKNLSRRIEDR